MPYEHLFTELLQVEQAFRASINRTKYIFEKFSDLDSVRNPSGTKIVGTNAILTKLSAPFEKYFEMTQNTF
jgi:hypothetical protein